MTALTKNTFKHQKDPTETSVGDEQERKSTHRDLDHVEKTKSPAVTIFLGFKELSVDDAPVFVDESVNNPALPEPFLRGVGVVEGRKPNKGIMLIFFAAGAVNVLATSESASQKLRIKVVKYSLDDDAPSTRYLASIYLFSFQLNCRLNG